MALDLSTSSFVSLLVMVGILVLSSFFDLRHRRVPNQVLLVLGMGGLVMVSLTGHLYAKWTLHVTAIVVFLALGYALFRLEAIGGADLKTSLIIGVVSPGVELGIWTDQVFEAFIASTAELAIMLLLGYVYWRMMDNREPQSIPLIPGLLVGYLLVQTLVLF